ncbi:MAG: thiamine phosphate synthase [Janthinobacterium lividum]
MSAGQARARRSLAAHDVFAPPASALRAAAETIRARLGDWPAAAAQWRFRRVPSVLAATELEKGAAAAKGRRLEGMGREGTGSDSAQVPGAARDDPARSLDQWTVLIVSTSPVESLRADWHARGAKIIDVSGATTILIADGERHALRGTRPDDWLAALAAFADCGFALLDALCLALAWREPDAAFKPADATDATAAVTSAAAGSAVASDADDVSTTAALPPCWPSRLADFPVLSDLPARPRDFPRCPPALGLYPVVPDAEWVERLIALGVRTIQLRVKTADPDVRREQIVRAVSAARRAPDEVRLFINDHWRLAIDAGAYGVHLGQEDMATADLDAIAAAGLRLGLSTHGYYEILRAWHFRPSYIACGAVFPTTTKVVKTAPQGVLRTVAYQRLLGSAVPVVAIGGIDLASLPVVLATGVRSAAVVSAVTHSRDLIATVNALRAAFPA